jgi:hypothetical protein
MLRKAKYATLVCHFYRCESYGCESIHSEQYNIHSLASCFHVENVGKTELDNIKANCNGYCKKQKYFNVTNTHCVAFNLILLMYPNGKRKSISGLLRDSGAASSTKAIVRRSGIGRSRNMWRRSFLLSGIGSSSAGIVRKPAMTSIKESRHGLVQAVGRARFTLY